METVDEQTNFIEEWNKPIAAGLRDYSQTNWDWNKINWNKIEQRVFNLQKRIYKATKAGQTSCALSLIKLLNRSTSAVVLGVRRITQDNMGKRSSGIDGLKFLTPKARERLAKRLIEWAKKGWDNYRAKPAKRKYVPKANGQLRPLGIPTQEDRVIQHVVKSAIEPFYEAQFESNSYGFRPAMSTHDAIEAIFKITCHEPKWVLDADIKGCFDNIDHNYLIKKVIPSQKPLIKEWLKAGYIDDGHIHPTEKGTPQGGIISPLLANIALDGLEKNLREKLKEKFDKTKFNKTRLTVVRYADDFVIIHKDIDIIEESQLVISHWLKSRGLELSQEKTKIVNTLQGFDFLGFNIKWCKNNVKGQYKRKLIKEKKYKEYGIRIIPSSTSIKKHKEALKEVFRQMKTSSQDDLIKRLNPIIRGWTNYFRYVHSWETFSSLEHWLWSKLKMWTIRRHPLKGTWWIMKRYFQHSNRRIWSFKTKNQELHWYGFTKINAGGFIKVKMGKSFYDGDEIYWAKRLAKGYGNISVSKALMVKRQNGKCPFCKANFKNGDLMESHHLLEKKNGGLNEYKNLILIHKHCHDQLHALNGC